MPEKDPDPHFARKAAEATALLAVLALGERQMEGKVVPLTEAVERLRLQGREQYRRT